MNFETTKLKAALERLCLVAPKRGTLPVLENIRWRVVNRHLELTATDLENSLHISMPLAMPAVVKPVDVLVPAKELYQAVKSESAPNMEVQIHDRKFELLANNRTLVLSAGDPKNFPKIPDGELTLKCELLSSALEAALMKVLFCVSAEPTRYQTNAIRLELRDRVFRIVGTDGHRMSVVEGAAKAGADPAYSTLLLRSTASILGKLASGESCWVELSASSTEDKYDFFLLPDGFRLIARRGEGQFPNYENVMPKGPLEATVVFEREELLDGLARLSATARKGQNPAVKLDLSKSSASIKAENDGTESRIALRHARVTGKTRDIGFNHQYLTQYVKSLETDTISMKLFPPAISQAALFDSFRYQHLIMPIRE